MGKKKIDRLKLIENKMQRNVAFCKRKRGFLKKAIELSLLCAQNIMIIIHDPEKNKVVHYSSTDAFNPKYAYTVLKEASNGVNKLNFESFTNEDY